MYKRMVTQLPTWLLNHSSWPFLTVWETQITDILRGMISKLFDSHTLSKTDEKIIFKKYNLKSDSIKSQGILALRFNGLKHLALKHYPTGFSWH